MQYDEFKRRLGKAGLSIKEFAALIGVSCNTVSNYAAKGVVPSHLAIEATLMSEMAERNVDFRQPLSALQLTEKKPRGGAARGVFGGSKQQSIFEQPRS